MTLETTVIPESTVFIVDDDSAARDSVAALAEVMSLKGECFASAEEFLDAYDPNRPGCLVTDFRMLGMDGIAMVEKLSQEGSTLPVIMISAYADVPVTVRAMQAGAITLLEKPCRDQELWDSIREALARDATNRDSRIRCGEIMGCLAALAPEEREVLDLMVAGKSNKVIANVLHVSLRTVEKRRSAVFKKTNSTSLAGLVRLVIEAKDCN